MIFPTHIVAVACLVRNSQEKVLLLKHPRRGWEFPGGQVEVGESLTEAAIRETEEETGITASIDRLVGIYSSVKTGVQYDGVSLVPTKVLVDFVGTYMSGEPKTSSESLEVGWFEPDAVLSMITHPTIRERAQVMLAGAERIKYRAYDSSPYVVHEDRWV